MKYILTLICICLIYSGVEAQKKPVRKVYHKQKKHHKKKPPYAGLFIYEDGPGSDYFSAGGKPINLSPDEGQPSYGSFGDGTSDPININPNGVNFAKLYNASGTPITNPSGNFMDTTWGGPLDGTYWKRQADSGKVKLIHCYFLYFDLYKRVMGEDGYHVLNSETHWMEGYDVLDNINLNWIKTPDSVWVPQYKHIQYLDRFYFTISDHFHVFSKEEIK